ncbi:MAG: hypothetical protein EBR46_07235 [Betaproteobacteria bacterium]|nr:hypothetical protein [Betaproteobacteria bacterium]
MTNQKPKNRFYWVEGVTRNEVEKSLADRQPSRLRQQGPRRALVLAYAAVLVGLAASGLLPGAKLSSYLTFVLLALAVYGYLQLRKAVRHVSDAPDELIDERQIAVRNAAYLGAYRWLALICCLVVVGLFSTSGGGALQGVLDAAQLERWMSGLGIALLMTVCSLPAMVLGWQLPSELQDERPDEPLGASPHAEPHRLPNGPH